MQNSCCVLSGSFCAQIAGAPPLNPIHSFELQPKHRDDSVGDVLVCEVDVHHSLNLNQQFVDRLGAQDRHACCPPRH